MSSLVDFIHRVLPSVSNDDVENLVRRLDSFGIRTEEDCSRITLKHLDGYLEPKQRFKFLDVCKKISDVGVTGGQKKQANKKFNIILLGETGVGKSTWINGFANYLKYRTLDDAERGGVFSVIPTEFVLQDQIVSTGSDENEVREPGQACTQLPQTYIFTDGDITVKLIDTPGIGDPRGLDQDRENLQYILTHIASFKELHAIVILLKPNEARLKVNFVFCIMELLKHLSKRASGNILFCFTHTKGTFYRPGDTVTALRELFKTKPEINVKLDKDIMYCVDSDGIRYLFAVKVGVHFDPGEKQEFANSYAKSVMEVERLLRKISKLEPHLVKFTLSLNDSRRMIVSLIQPLAEISANLQQNINVKHEKELELHELSKREGTQKQLPNTPITVSRVDVQAFKLDHPRTVCTKCNPSCDLTKPDCSSVRKTVFGRIAAEFGYSPSCKQCGCPWKVHQKVTFGFKHVETVEHLIHKSDMEASTVTTDAADIKYCISMLKNDIKNLQREQKVIIGSSAKFACYLKKNSIAAYNDAMDDYFGLLIEVEKNICHIPNTSILENLETVRKKYKEETKSLEEALSDPKANVNPLTSDEIYALIGDLKALKHTGKMLKETLTIAEEAEKQFSKQKEKQFAVNNSGAGVENKLSMLQSIFTNIQASN